ncbi:phosphoribosylaminoimidazole carboxylase catalytic subunit [Pseudoalteromonas tunicata D2]|jgi:hypothetical protein|uniref:Phosphoribosylaminoimidazole carboxylase catalytic subunit n=1 Tax=Pseudoalteromonas tunicata D2 TaxID=87626 RepID=A4C9J8_9GAMM|nr:phosphoribosylaminoimidazole carboxylase catalytic subunit [Pseudoalteromonas tunicata D2]
MVGQSDFDPMIMPTVINTPQIFGVKISILRVNRILYIAIDVSLSIATKKPCNAWLLLI